MSHGIFWVVLGLIFLNPLGNVDWLKLLKTLFISSVLIHRRKKALLDYWEFSLQKWNWLKIPLPSSVPCSFSLLLLQPQSIYLACFTLTINLFTHFFLANVFLDDVVTWANICQKPSHVLSPFEPFECLTLRNIMQKFIFPGSKL